MPNDSQPAAQFSIRSRPIALSVLLLITIVGAALRSFPVHESLWIDELHTAWTVASQGKEFTMRAHLGNNSTFYFSIVKAVTNQLGMHEWSLRLVSLLSGCGQIPLTYWLVRSWRASVSASLLAAALVAVDSNAIYFAGEARTYALVQFMAMLHLVMFSRLSLHPHRLWTWVAWIATGIMAFHLHCTAALIFPAEVVAYVILRWLNREQNTHWLYFAIGFLMIGLAMLPAQGLLRQIAERRDNWAMFVPKTRNPLAILSIYPLSIYALTPLLCCFAAQVVGRLRKLDESADDELGADELPENSPSRAELLSPVAMTLAWVCVPLVMAWTLTELDVARLFFRRYVVASGVALAPLSAAFVTWFGGPRRNAKWIAVAVFLVALATISPAKHIRYGAGALAHSGEDWRTPIHKINEDDPSIPVILYSGLIEADAWHNKEAMRSYCELPVRGIYSISAEQNVILLPGTLPLAVPRLERTRIIDDAWLLVRGDSAKAEEVRSDVLRSLGEGWSTKESSRHGRVNLYRLGK